MQALLVGLQIPRGLRRHAEQVARFAGGDPKPGFVMAGANTPPGVHYPGGICGSSDEGR